MSVLVYRDKQTACAAAATLIAAALIEKPSAVVGLDMEAKLLPAYASLSAMSENGLLDWSKAQVVQLCERVGSEKAITRALEESLLRHTNFDRARLTAPAAASENWTVSCQAYEDKILELGGMDLSVLSLRDDGGLLFLRAGEAAAPVTHVEELQEGRAVTAGISTLLLSRRLVILATGLRSKQAAAAMLSAAVSERCPASFLQLHRHATFLLDEEAASEL